jgi:hypothetical protein
VARDLGGKLGYPPLARVAAIFVFGRVYQPAAGLIATTLSAPLMSTSILALGVGRLKQWLRADIGEGKMRTSAIEYGMTKWRDTEVFSSLRTL